MNNILEDLSKKAAYGGDNWIGRNLSSKEEIGKLWADCGICNEYSKLEAVLLHTPGEELLSVSDPELFHMLESVNLEKAQKEHENIKQAYKNIGVKVYDLKPQYLPPPNIMFLADLFFMTPEGAILARPASNVRAGEEVHVARTLADLNVPVLKTIRGNGTFEGADAAWINSETVIVGRGLRTNDSGVSQLTSILNEMGVDVIVVDLPYGTMHLMGMLRFLDENLAVAWPKRIAYSAVKVLKNNGIHVEFIPDEIEAISGMALNFVTTGPKRILMPQNNPKTQTLYQSLGVECHTVSVDELMKATGAVGCLTGILKRQA
ncbi:MAG: amidinotransferase [Desulfobacteraceae bacterium]|nr:amidinotransferase [Desulfobacteraceae bacterium]